MLKFVAVAIAAWTAAVGAAAQAPERPDPTDAKAPSRLAHDSAFKDYRRYTDPEIARWREANEEMARLNGHAGHVPAAPKEVTPAAKVPPRSDRGGHGGHK